MIGFTAGQRTRAEGSLDLFIPGIPQPQGSKDIHHSGQKTWITEANAKTLGPWRDNITSLTRSYCQGRALPGPLQLETLFALPRPKGHFGKRGLLPSAPLYPDVMPDLDKLIRAVCDGLAKGGAMNNDSQIVCHFSYKVYVDASNPYIVRSGVHLLLRTYPAPPIIVAPTYLQLPIYTPERA